MFPVGASLSPNPSPACGRGEFLSPSAPPRLGRGGGEKRRALSELRSKPRFVRLARASCAAAPPVRFSRGPPRRGGAAGSPFLGYFLWRDKESDLPPATPANRRSLNANFSNTTSTSPSPQPSDGTTSHSTKLAKTPAKSLVIPRERELHRYWHASQSGLSIEQNFISLAGPAAATCAPLDDTALSSPPLPVDFSAWVAPRVRR